MLDDLGSTELNLLGLAVHEYLYQPNYDALVATLATAATVHLREEPLWLQLVAPPSSGKTEYIRTLDAVAHRRLNDFTLAGLLSVEQKKGAATGVLTELVGQSSLLTIPDLSSLLGNTMSAESKGNIFNALRDIYDGHFSRTMNKGTAEWHGRLTLIAAVTPVIDQFSTYIDALGPRFLSFRMPEHGIEERRLIAQMVRSRKDIRAARLGARDAATQVIETARAQIGQVELTSAQDEAVIEAALVVCDGRASIPRDYRYDYVGIPVREEPGRVTSQLGLLLRGALALGVREEVAVRVMRKAAASSMPANRARVVQALGDGSMMFATNDIARRAGMNWKPALRALEDWEAVGVAARQGRPPDAADNSPYFWYLDRERATALSLVFGAV
jgi:hypothetical protein